MSVVGNTVISVTPLRDDPATDVLHHVYLCVCLLSPFPLSVE